MAGDDIDKDGASASASTADANVVPASSVEGVPKFIGKIDITVWNDPSSIHTIGKPTEVQMGTFIAHTMEAYNYESRTLWGMLNEEMETWNDDQWDAVKPFGIHFRAFLVGQGVFVAGANGPVYKNIKAAITNDFHVWTQEDINYWRQRNATFAERLDGNAFLRRITKIPRLPDLATLSLTPKTQSPQPIMTISQPPVVPQMPRTGIRQPLISAAAQDAKDRGVSHTSFGGDMPAPTQPPRPTSAQLPQSRGFPPPVGPPALTDIPVRPQVFDLSKKLADLAKLYDSSMKYKAEIYDVFDNKFVIFQDCCQKIGIGDAYMHLAFSIMLDGKARDYYYRRILVPGAAEPPPLPAMIRSIKFHFENEEQQQTYFTMWREISFRKQLAENPDKTALENLEELFKKLEMIQRAVHTMDQSEWFLRNQLINTVRDYPACHTALQLPSATYEGVCNQLRTAISLSTSQAGAQQYTADAAMWTDRKYKGNGRDNRYGRKRDNYTGKTRASTDRKCYVCGKQGFWSTKRPTEERRRAYERYKNDRSTTDKSHSAYNSFLAWWEGVDGLSDEDNSPVHQYNQALDDADDYSSDDGHDQVIGPLRADAYLMTTFLQDTATRHWLTREDPYNPLPPPPGDEGITIDGELFTLTQYNEMEFHGIMPDTGAARVSTGGEPQFRALQRELPAVRLDESEAGKATIRFGPGKSISSIGLAIVPTPFGPINFHILPQNTPFLLCLDDMDKLGVIFNNLHNQMVKGDLALPLTRRWGHAWLPLRPEKLLSNGFLTEIELQRLHRRFGHPSVARLHKVLAAAGHSTDQNVIKAINKVCHHCQMNEKKPLRFKFSLKDDYDFNSEIIVDVMFLEGTSPVLHVVDTATSFNAALFLGSQTARHIWESLKRCWIDVYQGPPETVVVDAGKNFTSAEFKQNARNMAITVKEVPIEAHHSIGKVERYHAPLRRAYNIMRAEDPSLSREGSLQAAVKAVNDTAGPNGLVPTLLVFGAYPRMTESSPPTPTQRQRAIAIKKAMEAVRAAHAERKVADALATRNGPNTEPVKELPLQSLVRVWREEGKWTGPYRLIGIEGETCVVQGQNREQRFLTTVVRPYYEAPEGPVTLADLEDCDDAPIATAAAAVNEEPVPAAPPKRGPGRPRKHQLVHELTATFLQETDVTWMSTKEQVDAALAVKLRAEGKIDTPGAPFEESTQKEITALIDRGVFEFIPFNSHEHCGVRVFKSRIVNEVKGKTTDKPYEKSRLVIQGYGDEEKQHILTQSPTIQRASQRLVLALAPSLLKRGLVLWLRDITQAYVQSSSELARTVLARLPTQIRDNYPDGTVMRVIKPLYGIAEAGTHWWATYHNHHLKKLQMVTSTYDPCLLISSVENDQFGLIGMQTDDTIGLTTATFSQREEEKLVEAAFKAKPKEVLEVDKPLIFNGGIVSLDGDCLILRQKGQGKRLEVIDAKVPTAKQQYVEQRARGAYIASICQPEACFDLSSAAQHQDPTEEDIKALNKRLSWQMGNLDRGLNFMPLDLTTARVFVFVDGSFANNRDFTSQLGFAIILADEDMRNDENTFKIRGNLLHFSSTKSKRVTRSVLASEVYGMVAGVDMAYALSSTLKMVTEHLSLPPIPTIVCTDSYSLYECLVKLGTTKEKRLMIDIMALRQSYERRELHEVRWIHGDDNLADAFTKGSPNDALEHFINSNEATVRIEGWVAR